MPTCPCSVMILWKLSASHCLSVPSWPHEKNICVFDMNWRSVTPPWWAFFSSLWKLSTVLLSTRNDISKYALVKENYMFLIINSSKDYKENQKNKFWWFLYIYIKIYKHRLAFKLILLSFHRKLQLAYTKNLHIPNLFTQNNAHFLMSPKSVPYMRRLESLLPVTINVASVEKSMQVEGRDLPYSSWYNCKRGRTCNTLNDGNVLLYFLSHVWSVFQMIWKNSIIMLNISLQRIWSKIKTSDIYHEFENTCKSVKTHNLTLKVIPVTIHLIIKSVEIWQLKYIMICFIYAVNPNHKG